MIKRSSTSGSGPTLSPVSSDSCFCLLIAVLKQSKPVKVDKIIAKAAAGPLEDQQMPDSDIFSDNTTPFYYSP
ncbi:hypothetical protein, partial [Petrimonas mucosa]|uniref:hypothetical protein n=1 Tax=Petrimonas mucosa TaxID=1642646 RepID=UPI0023F28DF6